MGKILPIILFILIYIFITLSNASIIKSLTTPEQFGASGDCVHDDTIPVQKALDSSQYIVFTKCYRVSQIIIHDNQVMDGDSIGAIKFSHAKNTNLPHINASNKKSFIIRNMKFLFNDKKIKYSKNLIDTSNSSDYKIVNNIFIGDTKIKRKFTHVIRGDKSKNFEIEGNTFKNISAECIRTANSKNFSISKNTFLNIERTYLRKKRFINRCIIIGNSNNYLIFGNRFYNVGKGYDQHKFGHSVVCIDVGNAEYGIISGNIAEDIYSFLDIETSSDTAMNLIVSNNVVRSWRRIPKNVNVKHQPKGFAGIFIFFKEGRKKPVKNVIIQNNYIEGFNYGILASKGKNLIIKNNLIKNSLRKQINVKKGNRIIIKDNIIENRLDKDICSIYIENSEEIFVKDNIIINNSGRFICSKNSRVKEINNLKTLNAEIKKTPK